jgi:hypothetical protein
MNRRNGLVGSLSAACLLFATSLAMAIPVELKDSNDTKYWVNTDVANLVNTSNASGALTNATYTKPVTVTSTFIAFTPWWGFTTIYTTTFQVNIPLTPAFFGFNGLTVAGYGGELLTPPDVYNPAMPLAATECEQNGENRQLVFEPQAFESHNLQLQRKVFVPHNDAYARWMNIITNTGATTAEVDVSLLGKLGSTDHTAVKTTSTGDSSLGVQDTWFTTAQVLPDNVQSFQPKLGFVVQGEGAISPATGLSINTEGQTAATYSLSIPPGESQIILFFTTVQGKPKEAKKTCENLVTLPSKALTCMTEEELAEVVNFAHITPPVTSKAQIKLNFKKAAKGKMDVDSVSWKGTVDLGAGIDLQGLSVTVDVAGVTTSFLLNDKGKANNGGGNSFSVKPKLKDGVTEAGSAKFTIKLKGDYQAALEPYGWTNADVDDAALTAPLAIMVSGGGSFNTNQPFTYNAKEGKSGTGKYKQSS